ncbi:hypothetical protein GCK32_010653 [Trichostrongylus colubriformis]|uniref:Uncharacterized protein n=1 Tax=Trichostrongylus colubriformis TaxID=6319 RepID=A0AAN8G7I2_TRICO
MAETFLSCDTMKIHPARETKKEPQPMIVLSTAALATDDSVRFRRIIPTMPKMCCILPINAAAIFGIASTSLLATALYIYCMVHLTSSSSKLEQHGGTKMIGTLIATMVTSADEFNAAVAKADGSTGATVADLVIFRVVLGVAALVLAIELYAYIRLFLHIRAMRETLSR